MYFWHTDFWPLFWFLPHMVWAALWNIYADSQDIEICAGSNKGKLGNYGEDALKFSWNTLRILRSGRGNILPLNFFPKKKKKKFLFAVVSHIDVTGNLASLISETKSANKYLAITKTIIFNALLRSLGIRKKCKTKNTAATIIVAVLSALYVIWFKIKSLSKVTYLEEAGLDLQFMVDSSTDLFPLHAPWTVYSLMIRHDSLDRALEC